MPRLFLTLSLLVLLSTIAAAQTSSDRALDAQVARLEQQVDRLEATRAVKHLQRAYGFYTDRALWQEAADLFADDGTIEIGADGVYAGRDRVREYLQRIGGGNAKGLPWGRLAEHYQLQPVVHVAADGKSARGRWRDFGLLGEYGKSATWTEGVFENEYVKRNGVWMIKSIHLYVTFVTPYEKGWARMQDTGQDLRSSVARDFPPDHPATGNYRQFPVAFMPPFHYANPSNAAEDFTVPAGVSADKELASYWNVARELRDRDEIENLQAIYGYYFDKNMWDDVAQLFTERGTFEHGQQGVYVGRKRVRQALQLFGPAGPQKGWLNNYFQLQPVIHVSEDGRTAKGRWEGIMQLARPGTSGAWGLGLYENEYAKEGGHWKISKVHFYVTAVADYDLMWAKGPIPVDGQSSVLPPDRPPTEVYRALPGVYLPPFHYKHPVTGMPIVTDPQPRDSVLRPQ